MSEHLHSSPKKRGRSKRNNEGVGVEEDHLQRSRPIERTRGGKALSTRLRHIAERAAETGVMPLEVLVETMREYWHRALYDDRGEARERLELEHARMAADMAERAAPYMHPRLGAVQAIVQDVSTVRVIAARELSPAEWEAEAQRLAAEAAGQRQSMFHVEQSQPQPRAGAVIDA